MKRCFDIAVAAVALVGLAVPMLIVAVLVKLTSNGPALYWSRRVGRDNRIFWMPKFRTMRTDAPQVATHLLTDSRLWLTPIGPVLRTTSLDELPQLWSVLVGQMSLVGPRPALFNQDDLIALRTECGVHSLAPGLTGWAQINGRDEVAIRDKVSLDRFYLDHRSFRFDISIMLATVVRVVRHDGVSAGDAQLATRQAGADAKCAA